MQGKYVLLAIGLCLIQGNSVNAAAVIEGTNYNVTAFCTMVATNSRLGSIEACDRYYVCQSTGPVQATCSSGYWFDLTTQTCRVQSAVSCYIGNDDPCASTTGNYWLAVTGSCSKWKYCKDSVYIGTGSCPDGSRFNYATQACISGSCTDSGIISDDSDEITLASMCDVVPPNRYFGSTLNCTLWNYCRNGVLEQGTCTSSTQPAFDANNQYCTYTSNAVCARVTGTSQNPEGTSCSTAGAMTGSTTVCGNYEVCTSGAYVTRSCSTNYYFDANTKECVLRQAATPTVGCNRCQYSSAKFVNAVDTECCAKYTYCSDGVASAIRSCPEGYYFNENVQGCMQSGLLAYVSSNGACKGVKALCSATTTTTSTSSSDDSTSSDDSSSSTSSSDDDSTSTSTTETTAA